MTKFNDQIVAFDEIKSSFILLTISLFVGNPVVKPKLKKKELRILEY